jgi:uncharacterized membrane protein YphA (DoxX/SURF4 family)
MSWLNQHRDAAFEVLRVYLGLFLLIKGLIFLLDQNRVLAYMDLESLPFWPYLIVHYVAIAHLCGGLALAIGLVTRVAALIQVPILFGAILFVKDGNELSMLVLILLIVFSIYGSGKLSVDALLAKRASFRTSP